MDTDGGSEGPAMLRADWVLMNGATARASFENRGKTRSHGWLRTSWAPVLREPHCCSHLLYSPLKLQY